MKGRLWQGQDARIHGARGHVEFQRPRASLGGSREFELLFLFAFCH